MYINADTIIGKAASLLGAIERWSPPLFPCTRSLRATKSRASSSTPFRRSRRLSRYGLRGALQGLVEQGCNGPCKDALDKLDKHLNKSAHPHIKE